jgi:hypothetical protein
MREEAWPDSSLQAPLYIYRIKAVTSVEVDRLAPFQDMAMGVGPRAPGTSYDFEACIDDWRMDHWLMFLDGIRTVDLQDFRSQRIMPL